MAGRPHAMAGRPHTIAGRLKNDAKKVHRVKDYIAKHTGQMIDVTIDGTVSTALQST